MKETIERMIPPWMDKAGAALVLVSSSVDVFVDEVMRTKHHGIRADAFRVGAKTLRIMADTLDVMAQTKPREP